MKFTFFLFVTGIFLQSQIFAQSISVKQSFVLGIIDTLPSKVLNEKRVLNIYLPEGYSADSIYPVIYLLDGSADEDFIHIVGLVQFANFPWVNMLPKSIVVGIANVDRRRDFTFPTTIEKDKHDFPTTGGSANFITFLEKELKPYIEKSYRTSSSSMLIGESLGGLLATQILFGKPALFSKYVIVSPSLWWDNESLLSLHPEFLKTGFNQNISVYVAVGNEGDVMQNDAKKLVDLLNSSADKNLKVYFKYFSDKTHADIMHLAVYDAFEKFSHPDSLKN